MNAGQTARKISAAPSRQDWLAAEFDRIAWLGRTAMSQRGGGRLDPKGLASIKALNNRVQSL